jgi:hypothetical protein
MSVQGGRIPLEPDTTFRLRPNARDYLLWIRCANPLSKATEFILVDFWEFRDGDRLLITNQEQDFPASVKDMEEGGPSLWKVRPGDRLAWSGLRVEGNVNTPKLIALIDCHHKGYVYGEPKSPTLDSVMAFGAPSTSEITPEMQLVWNLGYDAAVSLGSPRT